MWYKIARNTKSKQNLYELLQNYMVISPWIIMKLTHLVLCHLICNVLFFSLKENVLFFGKNFQEFILEIKANKKFLLKFEFEYDRKMNYATNSMHFNIVNFKIARVQYLIL